MESSFSRIFFKKDRKVLLLGSLHNSEIITLNKIKSILESFKPEIVLIEGSFESASFQNEEEAIILGGDTGYLAFLSNKLNIPLKSNDPSFKECILFLEKKYGKDFSFLYFFLREKNFYAADELLSRLSYTTKWKNYDFSLRNIKEIFKEIFKDNLEDKDYSEWFNPTKKINIFNKATRELNKFRDEFMIISLKDSLKSYHRIFLMKGDYHLKKYYKKIRKIIKDEKESF